MKRKTILIIIYVITIIVSVFVFVKYKGYEGMFDTKKEEIHICIK